MTLVWNEIEGHYELRDHDEFLMAVAKSDLGHLAGLLLTAMGLNVVGYPALVDYLHVEDDDPVRKDSTPFETIEWNARHL